MASSSLPPAQKTLQLNFASGPVDLDVGPGGRVQVPYEGVRQAMSLGFAMSDLASPWPPRQTTMSPPKPVRPGEEIPLPDGTTLKVPAPCHQALEVPQQFVRHFESLGWVRLSQFA